jgi:hypothetical protein
MTYKQYWLNLWKICREDARNNPNCVESCRRRKHKAKMYWMIRKGEISDSWPKKKELA